MSVRRSAHILVVDDEPGIRSSIGEILTDEGYAVSLAASAAQARRECAAAQPDLVLLDIWMEGEDGISLLKEWAKSATGVPPVVMMSGHGTVDTAIEATRLGALDFIEKPVSLAKLLHMVEQSLKATSRHREPLGATPLLDLIDAHPAIARLKQALAQARSGAGPVLFVGEAGSGRATLARRLAHADGRSFDRLAAANLTAADIRERADRAREPTLLFVADLHRAAEPVQAAFLALATRTDHGPLRLAASLSTIAGVDDPAKSCAGLAAFTIEVPSLREYREFIPDIVRYFVDELADGKGRHFRRFDIAALNRLRRHDWNGNLRELTEVLARLLASASEAPVALQEVDDLLAAPVATPSGLDAELLALPFREARERFERAYLEAQLELAGGKVAALAERVELERTHLYRKLRALGIELSDERAPRAD